MSSKKRPSDHSGRAKKQKKEHSSESSDSSDSEDQSEVMVDFSAFEIASEDLNGIRQLLQQLFLKNHLDLNEFVQHLLDEDDVGLVIKETEIDEVPQGADGVNEEDTVYGVLSVVHLSLHKELQFVSQLRNLFLELSKQHAVEQTKTLVESLFSDPKYRVGFLINERFSNLPPMISVPSLTRLKTEIDSRIQRMPSYHFTHFIMMCKLYKIPTKKNKQSSSQNYNIIWCNAEEEVFDKAADARFEFEVVKDCDSALGGTWTEDDIELVPYRRVLIFSANKFSDVINEASEFVK